MSTGGTAARGVKMPDHQAFIDLIEQGAEGRSLEFKQSMNAQDQLVKAKIARTIMAMANLQDGGRIVIGMKQVMPGWQPEGVRPEDFGHWSTDNIMAFTNAYADPFVECEVVQFKVKGTDFVGITVREFRDLPVVCKLEFRAPAKQGAELILQRGALYIRSTRIPETVPVSTQTEMREILDIAIEKGVRS